MTGLLPVAVYGLKVPAGDVMIPSLTGFRATFRLTMAAIDPTAEPEHTGTANGDTPARATLKLIYDRDGPVDDEESDEGSNEQDFLKMLFHGGGSDEDEEEDEEESSSDDEEVNGGPSDPSRSKKARKQAAAEQLMKALAENADDGEMDVDDVNGVPSKKKNKGKGKAMSEEDEEDSGEEDDDNSDMKEVVVCTLDPQKTYQQPLDLTIGDDQRAFFKVSGTHAIYLTGNYVIPAESGHRHEVDDYDEEDGDLSLDEDELDEEDESDELDDLEDPRITEVDTDEEEAPKLVKNEPAPKKGKNKRAAEDPAEESANLDDIMAKSLKPEPATNGEPKLSKKQMKKLKNNAGKAVEAAVEEKDVKKDDLNAKDSSTPKADKKVQFAKNLEQGPSGTSKESKADAKEGAKEPRNDSKKEAKQASKAEPKAEPKTNGETPKASLGSKTLQGGVKIDDRKLGRGPACKKGNKVGMRYIGKLMDGKVFDANKKGAPFTFTLGSGEVIKGWDIGVAGMSVGGERRIEVPANLAYGSKSMPGIPANSPLKFDVKLLQIN
ncbi:MAG: hypothetical protein LQ338_004676 [Usnochroma carphineum]|nr:MAG: hypothetical protein LQ338_004676 [Usnochroma carphineum]